MKIVANNALYYALPIGIREAIDRGERLEYVIPEVFSAYTRQYLISRYYGANHIPSVRDMFRHYLPESIEYQSESEEDVETPHFALNAHDNNSISREISSYIARMPKRDWNSYEVFANSSTILHGLMTSGIRCPEVKYLNKNAAPRPLKVVNKELFYAEYYATIYPIIKGIEKMQVCWAGGMLNKMLTSAGIEGSDIDLFVLNTPEAFKAAAELIRKNLTELYPEKTLYFIPKSSVLSIHVAETAISVQIIMTSFVRPSQVVSNFDWSHCAVYMHGGVVSAIAPWFATLQTNVSLPILVTWNLEARILKAWYNGYEIADSADEKILVVAAHLNEELRVKKNLPALDKLSMQLHLTSHEATNRYLLSLHYNGDAVLTELGDVLELIDYDSCIDAYSAPAIPVATFRRVLANHIISRQITNSPLIIGRKPALMLARGVVITDIIRLAAPYAHVNAPFLKVKFLNSPELTDIAAYLHSGGFKAFTGLTPPPFTASEVAFLAEKKLDKAPISAGDYLPSGKNYVPVSVGTKLAKLYFHIFLNRDSQCFTFRIINVEV